MTVIRTIRQIAACDTYGSRAHATKAKKKALALTTQIHWHASAHAAHKIQELCG